MSKKFLFPILLLSILFSSLSADSNQYEDKVIKNITVEAKDLPADSRFQPSNIENKLRTKVGERFIQSTFDEDLKALAKDYDYVDPVITTHNQELFITLKLSLRPTISSIDFEGNYHFSENKLKKELGIAPMTTFNRQEFIKKMHKIRELYLKKGYFEADIDYKFTKNKAKNEIAIAITINSGRSGFIDHIEFEGFSKEEVSKVKDFIHLGKYNRFISWVTKKGIYNEQMIDYDKVQILEFLRNQGYANAKLEIVVSEVEKNDRIALAIRADKGELFKIGKVTFSGNKDFKSDEILSKILVADNSPYSPKKIQDSASALTDYYGKKGYIDASIAYEPHLLENDNTYDIHFDITEGEAYKVGLIKIIGNNQTFPKVILREANLEPGATFDTKMLEVTRKRLENIGYYKHVDVYPSATASTKSINSALRDVSIQVQETTTGSLGMNVGFSTVGGVYGGVELSEKNFNLAGIFDIPAQGISSLRGGGEYLSIKSSIGVKITDYSLNWTKPFFFDSNWTLGVSVDKNFSSVQSDIYKIESFTTSLNSYYPINIFVTFNAYYRFKDTNLIVSSGASPAIMHQKENSGVISSVGLGLQYETRNNFHRPTQGVSSNLSAEYAGVGGKFFFFTFGYNNSIYIPAGPFVLKSKANFNFIQPITSRTGAENIPLGERFFLATDISEVRGYSPFALGPQFPDGQPAGGITSAILSQEIMLGLIPKFIDIFAFVDAGALTDRPFKIDTFRASAGVGARVVAAQNLPLMVGWGYPINPARDPSNPSKSLRRQQSQNFFISLGGKF